MTNRWFFLALPLLLYVYPVTGDQFVLSTADTPPFASDERDGFYDLLLTEAFARAGHQIEIVRLPSERSIRSADQGVVDGEYGRIPLIQELYSHLSIVPEPLTEWRFSAFVRSGAESPRSFQDLGKYHVAYINGWKIYEDNVTATLSTTVVDSEDELFGMLLAGRVDVALYNRTRGLDYLRRQGIESIILGQNPLATRTMHLFLHESHADLAEEISEIITQMKADGSYAIIQTETIGFVP